MSGFVGSDVVASTEPPASADLFGASGKTQVFPTLMWNPYWPGCGSCMMDGAGIISTPFEPETDPVSGCNGRLAFVGTTRDEYGSPLPGCVVKVFRTSDDSLQSQVTSDDNGVYTITTPFADSHYLIVYKAGPPDICGTTVNTLAPG